MGAGKSDEQGDLNDPLLKGVRARVAISHFKRSVLGDLHVASSAQSTALFETLEDIAFQRAPKHLVSQRDFKPLGWLGMEISPRGWEGWYGARMRVPKPGKLRALDAVASRVIRWCQPSDDRALALPSDFYVSMVHGGLLQTMLAPTEAIEPGAGLLRSRALSYRPRSAWHLHLDALEVRAFGGSYKGVSWEEIIEIATGRVLDILHRLWRPMGGRIYGLLSSDTRMQWTAASDEERVRIREAFARLKPDQFEASMVAGARPSWRVTGLTPDIPTVHAHRLLFAIGADRSFLLGDRLSAWAMDLATAGIAAHALAWTDRYRLLGREVTEEQIFLAAIDALLLSGPVRSGDGSEDPEVVYFSEIDRELYGAIDRTPGDWSHVGLDTLRGARATYLTELIELGLTLEEVRSYLRRAERQHKLEYLAAVRQSREGTDASP